MSRARRGIRMNWMKAGYPARCGLSIPSLMSLEHWIRLRSLSYGGQVVRSHARGAMHPRFAGNLVPRKRREQGMPGARCTRGLACKDAQKETHTSIQVQTEQS